MASSVEETKVGARMMPYLAILQHDLGALWASRLVRLWLAATVVLTFFLAAANWPNFQDGTLVASLLFPYLVFPWFFVIVVLGVSPVSGSRAEALADGSQPVLGEVCDVLPIDDDLATVGLKQPDHVLDQD